jgi:hypothetical protein
MVEGEVILKYEDEKNTRPPSWFLVQDREKYQRGSAIVPGKLSCLRRQLEAFAVK